MNKYYLLLGKVLAEGKTQQNKKGKIKYLLNEQLTLTPADLLDIFESHGIARKKLKEELKLFMQGERNVERYREAGIAWWDYCGQTLVNSTWRNCHHLLNASTRRNATAKTMYCFSEQRMQRATRHRV